jgi:hypothetical protein
MACRARSIGSGVRATTYCVLAHGLDLEDELVGVLARVDCSLVLRIANGTGQPTEPVVQESDESISDRSRLGVDLGRHGCEKAAPREGVGLDLVQVALGEPLQTLESARRTRGGLQDEPVEDLVRPLDGRELKVLLRAKWANSPLLLIPTASASRLKGNRAKEVADRDFVGEVRWIRG